MARRHPSDRQQSNTKVSSWFQGAQASLSAYELIESQTVGAGGSASITFTVPAGYQHIQVRGIAKISTSGSAGDNYFCAQLNADATYSNYRSHWLYGDGASASSTAYQAAGFPGIIISDVPFSHSSQSGMFGAFTVDILDYQSTSKNKTFRTLGGTDRNGSGWVMLGSGLWMNTAAITSLTFKYPADNFAQYSTFSLYGIKAA